MTAKMIRYDDEYVTQIEEFINSSNGHIKIVEDPNLALDPYFYERREYLHKLREDIKIGKVKMYESKEFENEMEEFENELILKYGN